MSERAETFAARQLRVLHDEEGVLRREQESPAHPPSCVCLACCDRRGGKRAADVHVSPPPRQLPDLAAAGHAVGAAGWGITKLVYGTAFWLALLLVIYVVARP